MPSQSLNPADGIDGDAERLPQSSDTNASSSSAPDLQTEEPGRIGFANDDFAKRGQRLNEPKSPKPRFTLKKFEEGQRIDWWFASTGIPLLAATLGPLANVLSIGALVTYWRETVFIDGQIVSDFDGVPFKDPRWCYWLNVASLICGFLGNIFLLLNFTQRIRYIIALPASIIFWYLATGFLIGITACMQIYAPPNRPKETYTQGFWNAIAAAALYLICSMILMVNMLGYFLGHYPDHFALSDAQRTLILQTMLFFIWLAGGGAVFSRIEGDAGESGWSFTDALYFCDVTILTVGFGDLYPTTNVGRGLVFPYSVGGIITLGLVISSLYKFMRQLGEEKIIYHHLERMRERTIARTVTSSSDLEKRERDAHHLLRRRSVAMQNRERRISAPIQPRINRKPIRDAVYKMAPNGLHHKQKPKLVVLREEKDRFEAMRSIQHRTAKFKRYTALIFSIAAFSVLWCVGAVVFWQAEKKAQDMTYFTALYFCYVSLLTIGYGDLAPKSNAGRTFFVVWSLIAVPTMTILVSDLGDTVVAKFKSWSSRLADFTVLPRYGIWRDFLEKHPWLLDWIQNWQEKRAAKKRLERGFGTIDPEGGAVEAEADAEDEADVRAITNPSVQGLATEAEQDAQGQVPSSFLLSRRLALAIRKVAGDLQLSDPKRYTYEEWVEFTRLIRFTRKGAGEHGEGVEKEEDEEGLIEWDWIGDNSPMTSGLSESEWLLNRLCESLVRLERRAEAKYKSDAVSRHLTRNGIVEVGEKGTKTEDKSQGSANEEETDPREDEVGPKGEVRNEDAQNQVLASAANGSGEVEDEIS